MRWIAVLTLLSVNSALASSPPPRCFAALAYLSASETPPDGLIRSTYLELFDSLGGHRLNSEALNRLAESENLFTLPGQKEVDLDTLGRRLKQFEQMLTTRGWLTDDVRHELREQLQARAKGMQRAAQNQAVAVKKGWLGQRITLPSASSYLISPDGRWVLTRDRNSAVPKLEPDFHVYDTLTKSVTVQGAVGSPDDAVFASDGSAVLFPENERVIRRVPFDAGILQWGKAEIIGSPWAQVASLKKLAVSTDPTRIYGQAGEAYLCSFDLKAKTRTIVAFNGQIFGSSQRKAWGTITGTTDIYVQYHVSDHATVSRYAVNHKGETTLLPGEFRIPYNVGATLLWTPNNRLIESVSDVIQLHVTPGADPILLKVSPRHEMGRGVAVQVMLHPKRNEVGVLLNPAPNTMRIDWYDLDTGAVVGTTKLTGPHYSRMKMSDDGERLFLYTAHNEIELVNPNTADAQ